MAISRTTAAVAASMLFSVLPAVAAQDTATPEAQAWIDIATFSGMGMPAGGMAGFGAMAGSRGGGNSFGNTRSQSAGRWVDVTLRARANPGLAEARQAVPDGFMSKALELRTPRNAPPAPDRDDEEIRQEPERPRGRMMLYWGCGPTVRPGQPRVLDMATAAPADFAKFFVARSATQRGAHSAAGRPVWPSPEDARMIPERASLVGEHAFAGQGIPAAFRFRIPEAQDLMPPLALTQAARDGATDLGWNAIAAARAYFLAAMGSNGQEDMVIWTSSEVADTGFGLMDYQTNAAVDRWLKEKVLLAPKTTACTVPKGIFGDNGAMLRLIAYGDELNLVHPPRPKDPKAKWEPVWAVKLRVKSVASGFLGMADEPGHGRGRAGGMRESGESRREPGKVEEDSAADPKLQVPLELLKGIFGR